ncbi:MAG: VWA domain-containing protein [Acidobacteriota bacterium]|nr:VWA domain-containing protein [Acidobacteriota bacterium]
MQARGIRVAAGTLCAAIAAWLPGPRALAQNTGPVATLQVYSRLTVVDVTATDASGAPVHNLQQSDFTILEDGKPQPIRNFSEVRSEWQEPRRQLPPNVYTNLQPPPPSRAVNILLLDFANEAPEDSTDAEQLSISTRRQSLVKRGAMEAVDAMPPGTRIAVVLMTNSLRILQSFTSDQAILKAAINAAPYDLDGNGGRQGVQRDGRNRMLLEAFEQIAADTAAMKVRKNLIWFAMGNPDLTDPNHDPTIPNYTTALFRTYAELMAAQVSIYPIDVQGVQVDALGLESSAQLSEDAIAEATGGLAFYNRNNLAQGVLKAVENGSNYYTIAYIPPNPKFDGARHAIDVRVDRPGIHLVFRKGYYADDTTKFAVKPGLTLTLSAPAAAKGDMKAPMSRGLPLASDLLFEVGVEPSAAARKPGDPPLLGTLDPKLKGKRLLRYAFRYVVPSEQIRFDEGPGAVHRGSIEFDIAVYNADDRLLTGLSQTLTLPMSAATYGQMVANHSPVHFVQQIDVPEGQLFVRVGVLDPGTDKYGTLELPLRVGRQGTELSAPPTGEGLRE